MGRAGPDGDPPIASRRAGPRAALWQQGIGEAPDPSVAAARIGATYLAEEDFDAAHRAYRRALDAKPGLFEACYGLAVLEQDAGDATAAFELAKKAVAAAPDDRSRQAAARIAAAVERFAAKSDGSKSVAGTPKVAGTHRVRERIGSKTSESKIQRP